MIAIFKKVATLSILVLASVVMSTDATKAAQLLQEIMPGEWDETNTTLLNGKSLMPPISVKVCILKEQINKNRDPNNFLKQLSSNSPSCQFNIKTSTASEVSFETHCKDPRGFAGDGEGKILIVNSKSTVFQYSVDGTLTLPAMPGSTTAPASRAMHSDVKLEAHWLSETCAKTETPTPPQQP